MSGVVADRFRHAIEGQPQFVELRRPARPDPGRVVAGGNGPCPRLQPAQWPDNQPLEQGQDDDDGQQHGPGDQQAEPGELASADQLPGIDDRQIHPPDLLEVGQRHQFGATGEIQAQHLHGAFAADNTVQRGTQVLTLRLAR